jgi:hypothetical protein
MNYYATNQMQRAAIQGKKNILVEQKLRKTKSTKKSYDSYASLFHFMHP